MKNLDLLFFIIVMLILIIPVNHVNTSYYSEAQGQQPIQFQTVYIVPTQPREGETIYIHAKVISVNSIKNITLYWSVNSGNKWNASIMVPEGTDSYKTSIPGQAAGITVQYYIIAFDVQGNSARWPLSEDQAFTVIGSGDYMSTTMNKSMTLRKGMNYLNITDAKISMKLNLSASLNLTVQFADPSSLNTTYSKIRLYSNSVCFIVNDSQAIIDATIDFTLIKKLDRNDDVLLVAYWRESNISSWKTLNVDLSENKNIASVYTTHLSEWVIGEASPDLELTVEPKEITVEINKEFNINTTVANIGGGLLLNISLVSYHVKDIICISGFSSAFLEQLDSKESKSLLWNFKAKTTGDYNIVFVATSGDKESATFTVKVHVVLTTNPQDNNLNGTSFLPFPIVSILFGFLVLAPLYYYKLKINE